MITALHNRIAEHLVPPQVPPDVCRVPMIYLADNEWGNETMWKVAQEWFAEHPDCHFVEIHEHAGWYLGFRRDGGVWCTANDMARCNGPFPPAGWRTGPFIRRQDLVTS